MKLYNFKDQRWYNLCDDDVSDDVAPHYLPQEPEAQNLYQLLRYTGVSVGVAMVRVLEVSLAIVLPTLPSIANER